MLSRRFSNSRSNSCYDNNKSDKKRKDNLKSIINLSINDNTTHFNKEK